MAAAAAPAREGPADAGTVAAGPTSRPSHGSSQRPAWKGPEASRRIPARRIPARPLPARPRRIARHRPQARLPTEVDRPHSTRPPATRCSRARSENQSPARAGFRRLAPHRFPGRAGCRQHRSGIRDRVSGDLSQPNRVEMVLGNGWFTGTVYPRGRPDPNRLPPSSIPVVPPRHRSKGWVLMLEKRPPTASTLRSSPCSSGADTLAATARRLVPPVRSLPSPAPPVPLPHHV